MSRAVRKAEGRAEAEEAKEAFRTRVLEFLEKLKKGALIKYDSTDVELMLDLMEDYDVLAKRVNNSLTITVFGRYATCTVRARVERDGEWRLRSVACRRR